MVYDDLAVLGTNPAVSFPVGTTNLVTPGGWTAPPPTEDSALFVAEYFNGDRSSVFQPELTSGIQTPAAFDEGGNFIRLKYGPLALYDDATPNNGDPGTLFGDYHILGSSPAVDAGFSLTATYPSLMYDFDQEGRVDPVDIGADEVQPQP